MVVGGNGSSSFWLDMTVQRSLLAHYVSSAHFHTCQMRCCFQSPFSLSPVRSVRAFSDKVGRQWAIDSLAAGERRWGECERARLQAPQTKAETAVIRRRDTWSRWLITGDMHNDGSPSRRRRCLCMLVQVIDRIDSTWFLIVRHSAPPPPPPSAVLHSGRLHHGRAAAVDAEAADQHRRISHWPLTVHWQRVYLFYTTTRLLSPSPLGDSFICSWPNMALCFYFGGCLLLSFSIPQLPWWCATLSVCVCVCVQVRHR